MFYRRKVILGLIELLGGEIEFINEKGQGTKYIVKIRQKVIGTAPVGSLVQE